MKTFKIFLEKKPEIKHVILSKKLTGLQGYFNIKQKCDKQNFSLKIRIRSGENYNMIWWSILFVIKPNVLMSSINIQIRGFADETYIQLLFVYNSYKQKCHLALVMYPICLLPNDSVEKSRILTLHGILVFIYHAINMYVYQSKKERMRIYQLYIVII